MTDDGMNQGLSRGWRYLMKPSHWPSMHAVLGMDRARRFGEGAKYGARLFLSYASRRRFMDQLFALQEWYALFQRDPTLYFIPLRSYLDCRFSVHRRFAVCAQDLTTAYCTFGGDRCGQLAQGEALEICRQPDFSIELCRNRICAHEGFWALVLSDAQGQPLFNLSFGFIGEREVLIASIQGVRKDDASAQEAIRTITKRTHGLRPHAMLLNVFQMLCQQWGMPTLLAIDPEHQIKHRKRSGGKGFTFDYRALWQESGGAQREDGYWALPATLQERQASDIPSHKRAQYSRRYELRRAIAEELGQRWNRA